MKIALDAAKFSSEEANQLRKAMATFRSRGNIEVLQDKMVGRMVERGYDPDFAQRCFNQIKGFGEYGFPESHAASFAHLVYVSSWLKWQYPAAFACALLNSQPMGFYAPAQIVRDAREHGVEVRAVDVNHSDWDCTLGGRSAAPRPAPGRGLAPRCGGPAGRARGARPFADVEDLRSARRRAGPCDPAAGRGRRLPLDRPRPARGAVGRAGAQAGARPAPVRRRRGARRGRGARARAACPRCRLRACGHRLPDRAAEPEGAPDALPARALCRAGFVTADRLERHPRRQARCRSPAWC